MAAFFHKRRTNAHTNPRLILLGAALIIAAGLVLMFLTRDTSADRRVTLPITPQPADFTLPALDGEQIGLADFRGRYVLVNFWATWCPPCLAEMPDLDAYHRAHQADGFTLLAVNMGEDRATVSQFINERGFSFPVVLDMQGMVFDRYGGDSLPTSFLIGPGGELVKAWRPGALTTAMLEADITPLLKG